jgi:hypothetical protein
MADKAVRYFIAYCPQAPKPQLPHLLTGKLPWPLTRIVRHEGFYTVVAIQRLVRKVAALSSHQFMPLDEAAIAQAKGFLGSYLLIERDLLRHAQTRHLTVAVRVYWPDDTEQVFLLRSKFWQHYKIHIRGPHSEFGWPAWARVAPVRGNAASLFGVWHFFVGRRRFDRLYSVVPRGHATLSPSQSHSEQSSLSESATSAPPPSKIEWTTKAAQMFLKNRYRTRPPKPGENKSKWARDCLTDMEKVFEKVGWAWSYIRRQLPKLAKQAREKKTCSGKVGQMIRQHRF